MQGRTPTFTRYFIELACRLAKRDRSAAALVVPLSIAFHGGQQYRACRRVMGAAGGTWKCAFFDREPHALFGEDVKTRAAILIHSRDTNTARSAAKVATTGLRKFTSRTRARLFESTAFTPLGSYPIPEGIPKLAGRVQAQAFAYLRQRDTRLDRCSLGIGAAHFKEAVASAGDFRVFVGRTAYNFINVFHGLVLSEADINRLSDVPLTFLRFASRADADVAFGLLSSRLAFWLWHVTGDGFHVSKGFLASLPFSTETRGTPLSADSAGRTANLRRIRTNPVASVNKGRLTLAFPPHGASCRT